MLGEGPDGLLFVLIHVSMLSRARFNPPRAVTDQLSSSASPKVQARPCWLCRASTVSTALWGHQGLPSARTRVPEQLTGREKATRAVKAILCPGHALPHKDFCRDPF